MYQNYFSLPIVNTFSFVYLSGYFYLASNSYFYKTNTNFGLIASSYTAATYRGSTYDASSGYFYVASQGYSRIDVFNTGCSLIRTISVSTGVGGGVAFYNNMMYVSSGAAQISVLQNSVVTKVFNINACSSWLGQIVFDAFGNLLIACQFNNLVVLYDYNGNYLGKLPSTSTYPCQAALDSEGRLVVATYYALDIYY